MAHRSLRANFGKRVLRPRYGPTEGLRLRTADGVRLSGARLVGPPDARVAIVLVHGFSLSSRTPRVFAFAHSLACRAHVIVPDLRGHGASEGYCTLAESESLDVAAAVMAAPPDLPVVTVGISLGGAAVLLHAGAYQRDHASAARNPRSKDQQVPSELLGTVAISSPGWWGAWDTPSTSHIQRMATSAAGRRFMAAVFDTRLADRCAGVPDAADLVAAIAPAFTLVIHDPADHYFGLEHAETLFRWANEPRDLWLLPGTGHGTDLLSPSLADRLLDYAEARLTIRTEPG